MENKLTAEQINKAKACNTDEELIALAKEEGIELTEAEATNLFAMLHPERSELADNELDNVTGGGCDEGQSNISDSREHCVCPADVTSWFEK